MGCLEALEIAAECRRVRESEGDSNESHPNDRSPAIADPTLSLTSRLIKIDRAAVWQGRPNPGFEAGLHVQPLLNASNPFFIALVGPVVGFQQAPRPESARASRRPLCMPTSRRMKECSRYRRAHIVLDHNPRVFDCRAVALTLPLGRSPGALPELRFRMPVSSFSRMQLRSRGKRSAFTKHGVLPSFVEPNMSGHRARVAPERAAQRFIAVNPHGSQRGTASTPETREGPMSNFKDGWERHSSCLASSDALWCPFERAKKQQTTQSYTCVVMSIRPLQPAPPSGPQDPQLGTHALEPNRVRRRARRFGLRR